MNLSDWLAVISIIMSTVMSLISIAVALRIFNKERQSEEKFWRWIFVLLKDLVDYTLKRVKEVISRPSPSETPKQRPTPPRPPWDALQRTGHQEEDEQKRPGKSINVEEPSVSGINTDMPGGLVICPTDANIPPVEPGNKGVFIEDPPGPDIPGRTGPVIDGP